MNEELHIIFDGPPSHESGRFVEVEDGHGKSISIGEWRQDGEYWVLAIPDLRARLEAAEKERDEVTKWSVATTTSYKRLDKKMDALLAESVKLRSAVLHVLEGLGEARLHYPMAEEVLDVIGAELKDALFLAALTEEPKEATKPGHAHHDHDAIEYHTGVSNHSQPGAYRWSK